MTDEKPEQPEKPAQVTAPHFFANRLIVFAMLVGVILITLSLFLFWNKITGVEVTDNATVWADVTSVQPQVSGYVKELAVKTNQVVKRGDTVIRLYTDHFEAIAAERLARAKIAEANIARFSKQITLQQENIKAAQADADVARKNFNRAEKLVKSGAGSRQNRDEKLATLQRTEAKLAAGKQQLAVVNAQKAQAEAELEAAKAQHRLAELDIEYSHIWAADDGVISSKDVEVGEWISSGSEIFKIVSHHKWIVANFKETQITHMKVGQRADITLDTYPGETFCGEIESFSPATGAVFSLTPADNATGNFTKIVQRVPVKILFKGDNPDVEKIKAGLSAIVKINVRSDRECS